jgi:peptidase E
MDLFLTSVSSGVSSIDFLKENINERTKLVVMPLAHHFDYISCAEDVYKHYDRYSNNDSIYWRTVRPFLDIGINPDRIIVINVYADPIKLIIQRLLAENTIIYFPGGFPENIVATLKKFKLVDVVKRCKVVVGESAGAMFWGKHFFVYKDPDYPEYKCYRGLKLYNNFTIIPHLNKENRIEVVKATRKFKRKHREKVFLIKDGGWVWYNTDKKKIIKTKDCYIYD